MRRWQWWELESSRLSDEARLPGYSVALVRTNTIALDGRFRTVTAACDEHRACMACSVGAVPSVVRAWNCARSTLVCGALAASL